MRRIVIPQPTGSGTVRGMITALRGRYGFLEAMPIGMSVQKREITGIILGSGRERILYTAGFSGWEWLSTLVLLRLCEDLCIQLEKGGSIADINISEALSGRSLIFVPQVNPDGADIAVHGSGAAGKNARTVRELGGNQPGVWQANARGVDISFNFNAGWEKMTENQTSSPCAKQWGGEAPESEPETAAIVGLCNRAKFRHALAIHSQGRNIYWKYGRRTPASARVMAQVMAAAAKYAVSDEESAHGRFNSWFVEQTGRPGFNIELESKPLGEFEETYKQVQEMLLLAALM